MSVETTVLTIDGRQIEVPSDSTILEAARRLGIPIPTLCHVEGLEPASSCFLCCVQIEGRKGLSPACSMPRKMAPKSARCLAMLPSCTLTTPMHPSSR